MLVSKPKINHTKSLKKKNRMHKKFFFIKVFRLFFSRKRFYKNYIKKKLFIIKFNILTLNLKSKFFNLLSKEKTEYSVPKKKFPLKQTYYLLKKKKKIEDYLSVFLSRCVELKLINFLRSSKSSMKFKNVYKGFYKDLMRNKINFFNRQFKEIYSSISLGMYLSMSKMICNLFALVIGYGRYRLLKKNLFYLFNLVECMQKTYSYSYSIRINISGKFKGKAKRTQLKYLKTLGA
jgi:hypothetical protein